MLSELSSSIPVVTFVLFCSSFVSLTHPQVVILSAAQPIASCSLLHIEAFPSSFLWHFVVYSVSFHG